MGVGKTWHWVDVVTSDAATVLAKQREQWTKPQTMWPAPTNHVRITTACGRDLTADAGGGNPSLAAAPEAEVLLTAGSRARLAIEGDRILAVGHVRVTNHPTQDAILAAHGIDVQACHAWARELDWWNDDSPNTLGGRSSPSAYVLADGRFTAGFAVKDGELSKLSQNRLPQDADYAYDEGDLLLRGIPHTVATTLRGRRLDAVVSAPALDGLGLRINAVRFEEGTARLRVVPATGWTSLI